MTALLKLLTGYFVVSTLTLPFLNTFWLGELPVLALIQLPKITLAVWLRKELVMEVIQLMGLSDGSFSPDYILARPYALAMAYFILLGCIPAMLWTLTAFKPIHRRWFYILVLTAVTDYVCTLRFTDSPSLTIY